jgi:Mn-dependent DtxR family transcriptional regulator
MTIWDDRILELIRGEGSGSPTELSESDFIRVSPQHVSRRLKTLAEHGMLQHLGNGVYVLTEIGEDYLDGEVDANELEGVGGEEGTADA